MKNKSGMDKWEYIGFSTLCIVFAFCLMNVIALILEGWYH